MTSTSGLIGNFGQANYSAAKLAIVGLSKSIALDMQRFGVRNNEIYLFSQNRPVKTAHTAEGWTPETVIDRVFPQFHHDFYPLLRSGDIFAWDPV
jgi:NAD(P)-dependent dehydrogenase (short-subunit alcohol dehydrogenase family)